MPTTHLSPAQAAAQITRHDFHWGPTIGAATGPITFGFRQSTSTSNSSVERNTFSQFTVQQMAAAEAAMKLWASAANVTFTEVNPGGTTNSATILFSNYFSQTDQSQAYAYFPTTGNQAFNSSQGDVWMNRAFESTTNIPYGSYDFLALLHEIGHALGLEHPGDYNAGPGQVITYNQHAQYVEDSLQYSIMSYFDASETGANHVFNGKMIFASTLLLHDIAAIQRLYGPNTTHATGNTVYGFNSNADPAYLITGANHQVVFCIWDGGGVDTLDCSGYSTNQIISLIAGAFSSVGALTLNVSIAIGTVIENAVGGSGNDRIIGNSASNFVDGGVGTDTFVLTGAHTFYVLTLNSNGSLRIVDLRSGSPDGTDTTLNIEFLQFADGTFLAAPYVAIETNGVTHLTLVGSTFFLYDNHDVGPALRLGGSIVVPGQFGNWAPIAAERTTSGYDVVFKQSGSDNFTLWHTDLNGNHVSSHSTVLTSATVVPFESGFLQDLNGDGQIGLPSGVIEANGVTHLTLVGSAFFLNNSSGVGPALRLGGSVVVPGQFGNWAPIAAERTTSGYDVVFKQSGSDNFTLWHTDLNGNHVSSHNTVLTSATVAPFEAGFLQDLNGDGQIGVTSGVIEANGVTHLTLVGSAFFLNNSSGVGPALRLGGSVVVPGQFGNWAPIAAERTTSGYDVVFKQSGSDNFTLWHTDLNGNHVSSHNTVLTSATVAPFEAGFLQDLNGDGQIGVTSGVIEANGVTHLTLVGSAFFLNNSSGVGPALRLGGSIVVPGQFGNWAPIAAERTTSGYDVVFKQSGSDNFTLWHTDLNGNHVSSHNTVLTSATVAPFEAGFLQDLNGDGHIGSSSHGLPHLPIPSDVLLF